MHRFPATAYLPMTPARTANCIWMLMFAMGLGEGRLAASGSFTGLHLALGLMINYLFFMWYRSDSDARGFTRSRPLSVAIVALPLATVPYYLLRTRQVAERGPALGAFVGLVLAMPLARWAGIGMHLAVTQLFLI